MCYFKKKNSNWIQLLVKKTGQTTLLSSYPGVNNYESLRRKWQWKSYVQNGHNSPLNNPHHEWAMHTHIPGLLATTNQFQYCSKSGDDSRQIQLANCRTISKQIKTKSKRSIAKLGKRHSIWKLQILADLQLYYQKQRLTNTGHGKQYYWKQNWNTSLFCLVSLCCHVTCCYHNHVYLLG